MGGAQQGNCGQAIKLRNCPLRHCLPWELCKDLVLRRPSSMRSKLCEVPVTDFWPCHHPPTPKIPVVARKYYLCLPGNIFAVKVGKRPHNILAQFVTKSESSRIKRYGSEVRQWRCDVRWMGALATPLPPPPVVTTDNARFNHGGIRLRVFSHQKLVGLNSTAFPSPSVSSPPPSRWSPPLARFSSKIIGHPACPCPSSRNTESSFPPPAPTSSSRLIRSSWVFPKLLVLTHRKGPWKLCSYSKPR